MKRLIGLIMIGILVLSACASQPEQSEEELRAEIKAELQEEMEAEAATNQADATEATEAQTESAEASEAEEVEEAEETTTEEVADPLEEKRTDVFYAEDLKAGSKISDKFELVSDYYYDTDGHTVSFGYELKVNEAVEATLIYNMEYDFYFLRIDEPIFSKDIIVKNPLMENGQEIISEELANLEFGVNPKISQIPQVAYEAAKNSDNNSIAGQATIENILVADDETSGTYSVVVSDFKAEGLENLLQEAYNFDKMPTLKEMCSILDITIEDVTTDEDGGYFMYYSHWANDDIAFTVFHDEEQLSGNEKLSNLEITSEAYTLLDIGCGDSVLKSFHKLGESHEHIYSHHDDSYAKYVYNVDGYALTFNGIGFDDAAVIQEDDVITNLSYYELLD